MTAPRIDALTGVRGLAAWLVVLYHVRGGMADTLAAPAMAVLDKGYLAVDLFFVLSGFVLWLTWGERFGAAGFAPAPDFIRKRIARVWPLHAVVLAATVAFAALLLATGRPLPPDYRWDTLPMHVLLIQNWGLTRELGWNDPSWSISTELAAYLCFPAAAIALARLRPARWVAVAIGGGLVIALDRLFAANGGALLGHDIARLGLARCLVEFGCGMIACHVWQMRRGTIVLGVALLVVVATTFAWTTGVLRETLVVPIAFAALVVVIADTSNWRSNPLSLRALVWLGEISYSTYLAHYLLWTLFKIVFVADPQAVPPTLVALYLALTLASSVVLHKAVEVPGRRLGVARQNAGVAGNLAPR